MIRLSKLKIYDKGLGKVKVRNRTTASDDILAVAISRDGHSFVASTFDRVYYYSEDKLQWRLNIDNFNSLSLSDCGRYLLIGTLTRLIYMDAPHFKPETAYKEKTKELPEEIKASNYWVLPVDDIDLAILSSDGKNIVVGGEKTLYYYNNLMEKLWTFEIGDKIWGISMAKDGNTLVSGSGKEVYYFNSEGKLLWQFRTGSLVRFPSLSSDGRRVLASSSKKIYLFSQRGQLLSEVETGTSQTVNASDELETIAGGSSTQVYCYNSEGKRLWEKEEKDFINMVRVTANAEGVIVGTGSDILGNSSLQVYHRDGTLLWSYYPKDLVKAVAADENGHFIIAGIGRKIKRFDNTLILTRTSITVSGRCKEILDSLRSRGIDVVRHEEEFQEYNDALERGKSEETLENLLDLERTLVRIRERFHMAKETIPNWLETLGVNAEITDELINGVFPLYNKYVDINDNTSLTSKKNQLDSYVRTLRKALESVDPGVLREKKSSRSKPLLRQKLSILSTTLEGIAGLNRVVKNLKSEKINFIFELEDATRNVILDHLSGKNYEKEIDEAIVKVESFEEKIDSLLFRIQKFETTIKLWREQETMRAPDSVLLDIKTSTQEDGEDIVLTIDVTNEYETPITKVNVRTFTKDSIFNFMDPDHGVIGTIPSIQPEKSGHFQAKFRSDKSMNIVVNGILLFEVERVEYKVKLPPMNISLLSPTISSYPISETECSDTMEKHTNYQESLVIMDAEMTKVFRYIQEKFDRFTTVRDKKASTEDGETRILWYSGTFGKASPFLITLVVSEIENQMVELSISSSSKDEEKGTAYVQDIMNYFRINYKHKDCGG